MNLLMLLSLTLITTIMDEFFNYSELDISDYDSNSYDNSYDDSYDLKEIKEVKNEDINCNYKCYNTYNSSNDLDECCICLETVQPNSFYKILSCCNKKIHSQCLLDYFIFKNLKNYDYCPLCRRVFKFEFELPEILTLNHFNKKIDEKTFYNIVLKYYSLNKNKKYIKYYDEFIERNHSNYGIYNLRDSIRNNNDNSCCGLFGVIMFLLLFLFIIVILPFMLKK